MLVFRLRAMPNAWKNIHMRRPNVFSIIFFLCDPRSYLLPSRSFIRLRRCLVLYQHPVGGLVRSTCFSHIGAISRTSYHLLHSSVYQTPSGLDSARRGGRIQHMKMVDEFAYIEYVDHPPSGGRVGNPCGKSSCLGAP
jgi:hypothetical protein